MALADAMPDLRDYPELTKTPESETSDAVRAQHAYDEARRGGRAQVLAALWEWERLCVMAGGDVGANLGRPLRQVALQFIQQVVA